MQREGSNARGRRERVSHLGCGLGMLLQRLMLALSLLLPSLPLPLPLMLTAAFTMIHLTVHHVRVRGWAVGAVRSEVGAHGPRGASRMVVPGGSSPWGEVRGRRVRGGAVVHGAVLDVRLGRARVPACCGEVGM